MDPGAAQNSAYFPAAAAAAGFTGNVPSYSGGLIIEAHLDACVHPSRKLLPSHSC